MNCSEEEIASSSCRMNVSEAADENKNVERSESEKDVMSDRVDVKDIPNECMKPLELTNTSKSNRYSISTQTPLTLTRATTAESPEREETKNGSTKLLLSVNSFSSPLKKLTNNVENESDSSDSSKSIFSTLLLKEMSLKFSHEATTQATPPHPSLMQSTSSPTARDVLKISTSLSSDRSGPKSEIVTVTTDYGNRSPDARSILLDVVDQNGPSNLPKYFPSNQQENETLYKPRRYIGITSPTPCIKGNGPTQFSIQETFPMPQSLDLPPPSRSSDLSFQRIRRRRWDLRRFLRCTSTTDEERPPGEPHIRGAPPTYSSIFAGPTITNGRRLPALSANNRSSFTAPIPPPSYAQAQGIRFASYSMDQLVSMSPSVGGIWSSRPTAAICPRCAAVIVTVVEVRRSTITHVSALILFLCGCWPCCIIPYCMSSCKSTDHYCPICRTYLGTYTPW